jgi:hypothetical protein
MLRKPQFEREGAFARSLVSLIDHEHSDSASALQPYQTMASVAIVTIRFALHQTTDGNRVPTIETPILPIRCRSVPNPCDGEMSICLSVPTRL